MSASNYTTRASLIGLEQVRQSGRPDASAIKTVPSRHANVGQWLAPQIVGRRDFYAHERQRCLAAADAWHPDRLLPRFEESLLQVVRARILQNASYFRRYLGLTDR
jgi:hypothetical protein